MSKTLSILGYTLLVFIMVFLSAINSSQIIGYVAGRYAPQYDIKYESLSGGLLSGLKIKSLSYKEKKIFDSFDLRWNPASLLYKRIQISALNISGLDTANIRAIIDALPKDEKPVDEEKEGDGSLPLDLGLGALHLSLKPLSEQNITLDNVKLDLRHLLFVDGKLSVDGVDLDINTSLANLSLSGGLQEGRIFLSQTTLEKIDVNGIMEIIQQQNTQTPAPTQTINSNPTTPEETSPLIPTELYLKKLTLKTLPFEQYGVGVKKVGLNCKAIKVDINKIIESKEGAIAIEVIDFGVDSNLTQIVLRGSLDSQNGLIEKLSIEKIDTLMLQKLVSSFDTNDTNDTNATPPPTAKVDETNTTQSPYIPKNILLKSFKTSILPTQHEKIDIYRAKITAEDLSLNVANQQAQSGKFDVDILSSYASFLYHGAIKDNHLESKGAIELLTGLFEAYNIPLQGGAIKPIEFTLGATPSSLDATINLNASKLLKAQKGEFNIQTLDAHHDISYDFGQKRLLASSHITAQTPFTKPLIIDHNLTLVDTNLTHRGVITLEKIEGIEGNFTRPLDHLLVKFDGDIHSINLTLDSASLKGELTSKDLKTGALHLATKAPLLLKNFAPLPEKLNASEASIDIKMPLDFQKPLPLKLDAIIKSNIANIDAKVNYGDEIRVATTTNFPKNSLLRGFDKALNIDALTPLKSSVALTSKEANLTINAPKLNSKITYNLENNDTKGNLVVAGAKFDFSGNAKETIKLNNSITSLSQLLKQLSTIYAFEAPPLDGDAKIALELKKLKNLSLKLNSNKLTFKADRKTTHTLSDTMIDLGFADSVLKLNGYSTTFQKQKFFATKPSIVSLKDGNVEIAPLWLNNQLKVTGLYNIKSKKGQIVAYANPLDLSHELIDIKTLIDLQNNVDGVKNTIKGKISILGGDIHYDMDTKSFASDSDIVIIQNTKAKSDNPALQNLSASIIVDAQKPLVYKTSEMSIEARPNLTLLKEPFGPLLVLGSVELAKGSYYQIKNKQFKLQKSMINFTGDPSKPLLDITAKLKTHNYDIKIMVTGTPSMPNIQFSSKPYLTREQILSVLLFDSEEAADMHSSDDMMRLMGGTLAKSALNNIGIKVDHLTLGADGNVELGKKLSKKLMIIYVNDKVSSVKLKYDINNKYEADITVNPASTSGDIFYKREF